MLKAALSFGHAARYIPHEIKFRTKLRPAEPRSAWLTRAEVQMLLDACAPKQEIDANGRVTYRHRGREHLYAFILISIATAARKEAVLSLKWDQIYFPTDTELEGEKLIDLETR